MAEIVYDVSGTLRADVFYKFGICQDDVVATFPGADETWTIVPRTPTADQLFLASDNPADRWIYIADAGDICGGARVSEFIPNLMDLVICSDSFRRTLEKSAFSGYRIRPFKELEENQSALKDPKLFYLFTTGYNCIRFPTIIGGRNECRYCGYSPLLSSEGFNVPFRCERCGQDVAISAKLHEGENDFRYPVRKRDNLNHILDGHRWDGSDFIGGGYSNFISKRVLDWLLATHAAPFYAHPIRFCTDGMTDEQLENLETMTKMPS